MATKVVMEALSPTMEEGRLVEWKKRVGEPVAVGDVLAEVETDKAVMELVARAGGVLLQQSVKAGTTVPVSAEVGLIGAPGEVPAAAAPSGNGAAAAPPGAGQPGAAQPPVVAVPVVAVPVLAAPVAPAAVAPAPVPAPAPAPAPAPVGRVKASPLARKIAADRGLDLRAIQGSGPEGRIIMRDVEGPTATAAAPAAFRPAPRPGEAYTDLPLSQIRKAIAKRLAQSIGPIPTFYLTTEVDMERVADAREALVAATPPVGADGQPPVKISFNDIVVKAVATALRRHPMCNAWWQDDHIRIWNEVHIGMAVAIEEGLITPVIRHADQKPLREIAIETRDLAGRARQRRLVPEEYTGSTFSISNLGMLDIDEFTAVINPPEAGILAVGRIEPRAVARDGEVVVRRRMRLTMSCDHRVIDGATGAQFLRTLKQMLENPLEMI